MVGEYAREQGALVPTRLVHSAKSWLSNPDVDRRAKILPWDAQEGGRVLSPVEARRGFWRTWRSVGSPGRGPIAEQDVVLTVPASFDEEARELTVEAAREAGITNPLCSKSRPRRSTHGSPTIWRNRRRRSSTA